MNGRKGSHIVTVQESVHQALDNLAALLVRAIGWRSLHECLLAQLIERVLKPRAIGPPDGGRSANKSGDQTICNWKESLSDPVLEGTLPANAWGNLAFERILDGLELDEVRGNFGKVSSGPSLRSSSFALPIAILIGLSNRSIAGDFL